MAFNSATLPDLFEAVGQARARSPRYIINDAMSASNSAAWFLMAERRKTFQGGTSIRHDIMLDHPRTFRMRDVDDTHTPRSTNFLTGWSLPWRSGYDAYTVREEEELTAPSGGSDADEGGFMEFIAWEKKMLQGVNTSTWEGISDMLYGIPNPTTQEASGGLEIMPLSAYVNEETGRLFGSETAAPGGAWTTVEGVNSASPGKYKWRNRIVGYSHSANNMATAVVTGAHQRTPVEALDDAVEIAGFQGPQGQGVDEYFLNTPVGASQNRGTRKIITTLRGKNEIRFLYRSKQDAFIKATDPWASDVQFAGYDIIREPRLETQALYKASASTALVTEGDAAGAGIGPRFHVLNLQHLYFVVHRKRYMYRYPVQTHPFQPWNQTIYFGTRFNLACESRMRQVMVSPGTVAGVFGTSTGEVLTRAAVYAAY